MRQFNLRYAALKRNEYNTLRCVCAMTARPQRTGSHYLAEVISCSFLSRLGWLLASLTIPALASVSAATDILILQSHEGQPYQMAVTGFESSLANTKLDATYQTLTLSNNSGGDALIQLLKNYHPKLIMTLGTPATHVSLAQVKAIPIVANLVLDTDKLRENTNATGVGLNFIASQHWLWLRRILPDARHIAVLYDPGQGTTLFKALQKQAQSEGIELIQAPVTHVDDLPSLMEDLSPQLDALWAVNGASAYSAAAVRELLLYSFRNRVPLIGLSGQWVKAGALYALDWDYDDLGAQAAELAKAILIKGIAPASLPPLSPRKVRAVLNMKTAEHMKLQIAERWLPEIAEVLQ